MKFKILSPTVAILFLASTMFGADKKVLIEIRASQTVDFTHCSYDFVGERTAQGGPLKLAVLRKEGTTNVFQETVDLSTVYKEHRYAVIITPAGSLNDVSQVFRLAMRQDSKPSGWTQWQRPNYVENSRDATSNFMDDQKSPDRSTNTPPNSFEVRYKIQ